MTPFYDDGAISIYNGDAWTVLSRLKVRADLLLTDPPYGLNMGYGRTALGLRRIANDESTDALEELCARAPNLISNPGWAAVFCGYTQVGLVQAALAKGGGLEVKTVIVWDKGLPSLGAGIRNQYELIVLARRGMPKERFTGGNVWRVPREHGRPAHPHAKPVSLLLRLIANYSPPGGLVLDPFMGAGSTLEAAKEAGRRAIGVELDEGYCKLAAAHQAQTVASFVGEAA